MQSSVFVFDFPLVALIASRLFRFDTYIFFAGSLESANSSILAARRHFKEVVGKKIRILL